MEDNLPQYEQNNPLPRFRWWISLNCICQAMVLVQSIVFEVNSCTFSSVRHVPYIELGDEWNCEFNIRVHLFPHGYDLHPLLLHARSPRYQGEGGGAEDFKCLIGQQSEGGDRACLPLVGVDQGQDGFFLMYISYPTSINLTYEKY